MRSEIVRLYKTVHTWAGIGTGLLLFIAFYAGAITLFEAPLERWLAPPVVHRTSLADSATLIERTLAARPDAAREFTLHLSDDESVTARLTWQNGRDDPLGWSADLDADGQLRILRRVRSALPQFIDDIHRTLGIPGDPEVSERIMGVVSVVYAVALVSGLIVVLPSLVKDFLALRVGRSAKRVWLDAHNVVGVVSLPFHLVMALSAVVFGLHDHFYDVQDRLIYAGQLKPIMKASYPLGPPAKDAQAAAMLAPQQLLAKLGELAPGFEAQALLYRNANTGAATVRASGQDARYMVRGSGFALLAASDGALINGEYLPGRQGSWSALVSIFFALHFGSFGGAPVRWSYFVLGLAGAFLFYSGNLLWIETRRRRDAKAAQQTGAVRWLAVATVGVCLGCVCGISATIAAGKWLSGRVDDVAFWHRTIYYALCLGCVAWASRRGAARAAVDLLWLASASTLAIPATSLLAVLAPSLGLWAHGSAAALGVDVLAAFAALGFAWMAVATRRRGAGGATDSVWSTRAARE